MPNLFKNDKQSFHPNSFCHSPRQPYFCAGEMAERSNAAVLKTVEPKVPGVRIPLSPLEAIFKEVQSPQIVDFRALFILLPHQIAPFHSKKS